MNIRQFTRCPTCNVHSDAQPSAGLGLIDTWAWLCMWLIGIVTGGTIGFFTGMWW